ncbi:ribosome assembly factor SBDS [Candidatus Woesearchaeota archaeon]|nr:ribosome assembly factor SBDS [Candidatus Woesearchaeota archaeon]
MRGYSFDRERLDLNTAKIKKNGETFEIVIDKDLALELKQGKNIDIRDILKADKIFHNAKKGELASEHRMQAAFGTTNPDEVAKKIIMEGDIPLSTEHKHKLREEKLKQITYVIHSNGVDPKTQLPHPIQRIETALKEVKFQVDENKPAQTQVRDALKAIRTILPIKFEIKEIRVVVPAIHAPKCYSALHSIGQVIEEKWQNDGSLMTVVEIPGGLEEDFYEKINKIAHGDMEAKVLKIR